MAIVVIGNTPDLTTTAVKTSAYTATTNQVVRCDPTAGAFPVTLPPAAGGGHIVIKVQSDSPNPVTLLPSGTDTVEGGPSLTLNARESVHLFSDGTSDWMVL